MSLGMIDSPSMRKLWKFLDKTKISVPFVLLVKGFLERFKSSGFKFKQLNMLAVGQSHLDAAWRWRKKQTILKAKATFTKALKHIKEHPRFSFAQTSPCYYNWMKTMYPLIYERIKEAVARGQWLLIGGMWIEPDLNVPSGESLVRQRLYGMRFYKEEFGKMPEIEFLQDTFGFCWTLPQILVKSGARMFGTGKIFWNDTNTFPIGMFHWRSPDGTTIPTILIHFGYFMTMNYGMKYPNIYRLMGNKTVPGKTPVFDYSTPIKEIREHQSKELMLDNIFAYGLGDGGHGPIEAEITIVNALKILFPNNFKFARQGDFYPHFEQHFNRWATWSDELYLELHRGTYTTNSKVKRYNRELEILLENCEKACTIASLNGFEYPREIITRCWKIVLFNQFHDILPGSSIPQVYQDAFIEYDIAKRELSEAMKNALGCIVAGRAKFDEKAVIQVACNFLSWERMAFLEIHSQGIQGSPGELIHQEIHDAHGKSLLLVPAELPPFHVVPLQANLLAGFQPGMNTKNARVSLLEENEAFVLENDKIRVKIDRETGYISSIVEIVSGYEYIEGMANRIMLFTDMPSRHVAWNIDQAYLEKPIQFNDASVAIEIMERGPLRCRVRVKHVHGETSFIQDISVRLGERMVRFSMDVDWHETETLFKLSFPTTIDAGHISSEIPYGYIDRPVSPETALDKARWEYSCQKWIDLSDGEKGVALLNNCKYGFNIIDKDIRLTVLNGPMFAKYAKETMFVERNDASIPTHVDQFLHEGIRYALHLHDGTWRESTWRKALEFNNPVVPMELVPAFEKDYKQNDVNEPFNLSCSASNVIITALKVHEDCNNLGNPREFVIRLVEMAGEDTTCTLSIPAFMGLKCVECVDLLEMSEWDDSRQCRMVSNGIEVDIGAHEIMTLLIHL
ncbi:hypothetical protein GF325_15975 [Candidatus Bathyarchaeota archaeon]|nr:hypothetical protein [Candidatus Bathyarchaeota archaeon]